MSLRNENTMFSSMFVLMMRKRKRDEDGGKGEFIYPSG